MMNNASRTYTNPPSVKEAATPRLRKRAIEKNVQTILFVTILQENELKIV